MEELVFLYQPCTRTAETYEMETFTNNGVCLLQDYHVAYIVWYLKKNRNNRFLKEKQKPPFLKNLKRLNNCGAHFGSSSEKFSFVK